MISGVQTPWEIVWGPDKQLYVSGFEGMISRVDPQTGKQTVLMEKVADLNMVGEGGLMGLVLDPEFEKNQWLYVAYTYREGSDKALKVVRWQVKANALVNPLTIIQGIRAANTHNGCRLAFDKQGYLFMTVGDSGDDDRAQDLSVLNGKTLRLHKNGAIPTDNPFGSAVWSYGHRNAQGLTCAPNGMLYSSEHGPSTDDEINIEERGRNYGWPDVEGFCDTDDEEEFCKKNNVKEPAGIAWTPTIAPGQLIYYTGNVFTQWKDHLLVIGMKGGKLILLTLNTARTSVTSERVIMEETLGRLRAICQSPDGRIFIGTSNRDRYGDRRDGSDFIIELIPR